VVVLTALAALALALDAPADPEPKAPVAGAPVQVGLNRFHLLPPYADPGFVKGPASPPQKAYLLALGEVIGIDAAIWGFDYLSGKPYAKISADSIADNFDKGWIIDTDDFWANSLMHPIHGNLTYNAARSLGLNFYESCLYSFIGSLVWEQFAEIQPPSMNDQVNTPFGGSMVGESMYRMYRLILDSGGYNPSAWRQFFGFLINPMAGLNRLFFGDKFRGELMLPASWLGEFRFGMVLWGSDRTKAAGSEDFDVGPWGSVSAHIFYGIPGTPGLSLRKPFDHFELQGSLSLTSDITAKATSSLIVRGLLLGETLGEDGESGLWGLFTSYDFIAPEVFRVQGFGLGPGIMYVKQWDWFTLYSNGLVEVLPWSGGGSTEPLGVRDYHYGPGGDIELEFRGHFSDRVIVRLEGRAYWITGAYTRGQSENILYGKLETTVRIWDIHGVSAVLDWSHRQAQYFNQPDIWMRASAFSLYYTLMQGW